MKDVTKRTIKGAAIGAACGATAGIATIPLGIAGDILSPIVYPTIGFVVGATCPIAPDLKTRLVIGGIGAIGGAIGVLAAPANLLIYRPLQPILWSASSAIIGGCIAYATK